MEVKTGQLPPSLEGIAVIVINPPDLSRVCEGGACPFNDGGEMLHVLANVGRKHELRCSACEHHWRWMTFAEVRARKSVFLKARAAAALAPATPPTPVMGPRPNAFPAPPALLRYLQPD